jgi:hypothetical protein
MDHFRNFLPVLLLFCLLFQSPTGAVAQDGGFAGSFSRMGFSPRGMAMGNAMSAVHQEGSYSYYNPALAAEKREFIMVDFSTAAMAFDRRLHTATAHLQLPPSAGITFTLMNARVQDIDGRSVDGYHTGYLSTSEFRFAGRFGIRFSEAFSGGIGLTYTLANYHTDVPNAGTIGLDIGFLIRLNPKLSLSAAARDLLASYDFNTSDLYGTDERADNAFNFPTRFVTGIAYELSDKWLVSTDAELQLHSFEAEFENRVVDEFGQFSEPIVRSQTNPTTYIRTGTRYQLHERVAVRGGLQLNDPGGEAVILPSAGFSLMLPYDRFSPSIDYAFVREASQLTNMHVFALRLHL